MKSAEKRKQHSIKTLKKKNVPYIEHLPRIESEEEAKIRTLDEIACRAACCLISIQHSFDVNNDNDIKGSHEFLYGLLEKWNLIDHLSEDEKTLFDGNLTGYKLESFSWKYEAYWVLAWALGLVKKLEFPTDICDVQKAIAFVSSHDTFESFLKSTKPRKPSDILDEADLIYRIHWAVTDARINNKPAPANLNSSVVMERHMALNWLIGVFGDDWDNMTVDT